MNRWTITIPNWHPCTLNKLLGGHWSKRSRLKRSDRELIVFYAQQANVPKAMSMRRVGLKIVLAPRQRAADPDAYFKSLLDGLVNAGLIVDDNRQHVELLPVEYERGAARATEIVLEDLPPAPQKKRPRA